MKFEILSHPERLLEEHVAQMLQFADAITENFDYNFNLLQFTPQIINKIIELHDVGKSSLYFQYYLREKTHIKDSCTQSECNTCLFLSHYSKIKKELDSEPTLKNHALIGALLALSEEPDIYNIISFFVINSHHGSLPDFSHELITRIGDDPSKLTHIEKIINSLPDGYINKFNSIIEILKNKPRKISKLLMSIHSPDTPLEYYFYTLTLYSLLLSSDKGSLMYPVEALVRQRYLSASFTDIKWIDNYRNLLISNQSPSYLNELRNQAWHIALENLKNNLSKNIFSLNLPTGIGKTLINLKLAQFLIEEKNLKNFKIIYCLPYTSIIDQVAVIIENALVLSGIDSGLLVIDHHLAQSRSDESKEGVYVKKEFLDSMGEYVFNSWESPVILTTFVQLWDSIFNNSGKKLIKFNNLSHSVIILDEIQNIPPQFHKTLETALLAMTQFYNTHFIISTATHPVLLSENAASLHSYANDETYFFKKLNRVKLEKYKVNNNDKLRLEELAEAIINRRQQGFSQLVILNTIHQSVELYRYIIQNYNLPTTDVLHLSSQHIPLLRRWKIRRIKNLLRQHNQKKGPIPLLISTQVVEAGVDLDFDIIWREFAPIDSINQAAGRCNRNGLSDRLGQVLLFYLAGSAPSKVYHGIMLSKSESVLDNYFRKTEAIDETFFAEINNDYFHEIKRSIADNSNKSDEMIQLMRQLKFESISTPQYRLIAEQPKYNIFLPINRHARALWLQYQELLAIDQTFETRRAIKKIIPQLLNYTVAVYTNQYDPQPNQMNQFLIFEESIGSYYDVDTGFVRSEKVVIL